MRWWSSLLILSLSGCSMLAHSSMDDAIEQARERDRSGCVYFEGVGMPPASQLRLHVLSAWGDEAPLSTCMALINSRVNRGGLSP